MGDGKGGLEGADIIKQSTAIQQSVCRVLTPYNLHRAMPISLALVSPLALSHLEIPDKGTRRLPLEGMGRKQQPWLQIKPYVCISKGRSWHGGSVSSCICVLYRAAALTAWHTLRRSAGCRFTSTVYRNVRLDVQTYVITTQKIITWQKAAMKTCKPKRVLTLRGPVVTICTAQWIWEQTAIISLYNINWLVFVTETECVWIFEC